MAPDTLFAVEQPRHRCPLQHRSTSAAAQLSRRVLSGPGAAPRAARAPGHAEPSEQAAPLGTASVSVNFMG